MARRDTAQFALGALAVGALLAGGCTLIDATWVACRTSADCPSNYVCGGSGFCSNHPTTPGAPTDVVATAGNSQVTLSWKAPASDGGSPITGYTVLSMTGGQFSMPVGNVTTTTLSAVSSGAGIVIGNGYSFVIVAGNSQGQGQRSAPSDIVTPGTVPDAPTMVVAQAGNGQASLSWMAPKSDGFSPITGYAVVTSGGGAPGGTAMTTTATQLTIPGLTNGTSYSFAVGAMNAYGAGQPTSSNSVTPGVPPGAPTAVSAVGGVDHATVSWTAPVSMGTSQITSYSATATPGGVTATTTTDLTMVAVTGLTAGTSYTFTVVATSPSGNGPSSSASNQVRVVGPPVASASSFTATPASVPADGHSPIALSLTLKDASGEPLTGIPVALAVSGTGGELLPPTGATNVSGGFTAVLTSTSEGMQTVTARCEGLTLTTTVTFEAMPWNCSAGELTQNPALVTSAGNGPNAVWAGDFNGDGRADVAVANLNAATMTLLRGSAEGALTAAGGSPFALNTTAQTAWGITGGDFNGDGRPDVVLIDNDCPGPDAGAGCAGRRTTVATALLSDGDGGFTAQPPVALIAAGAATTSGGVVSGDFNGDGTLDLAVVLTEYSGLYLLPGDGMGGFSAVNRMDFSGGGASGLAEGDFNGDGALDLAVANTGSGNVTILLGGADGGVFTEATGSPVTVGTEPLAITAGRFTSSGALDLAVVNGTDQTVTLLLGNGSGGFTAAPGGPVTVGTRPDAITAADLNGDGNLDLAVANSGSGDVTVLLGDGTGSFSREDGSPFLAGNKPVAIAAADFTGSDHLDLAVANQMDNTVALLQTSCWLKPGAPGSVTAFPSSEAAWVTWTAPADGGTPIYQYTVTVNPGGTSITTSETGVLFPGLTTGTSYTFAVTATNAVGPGPAATSNAVVVAGPLSASSSSFTVTPATVNADGRSAAAITVTLVDAASHPLAGVPVAIRVTGAGARLLPQSGVSNGTGVFTTALTSTLPGTVTVTAIAGGTTIPSPQPVTFESVPWSSCTSSPGFTQSATLSPPEPSALLVARAGDFTQDSNEDLALVDQEVGDVFVYPGNGGGGFGTAIASPAAAGQNLSLILTGDFNNDGIPDLATFNQSSSSTLTVLLSDGHGGFSSQSNMTGADINGGVVGDFNGDGNLDFAVTEYVYYEMIVVQVLLGDGTGGFTAATGTPIMETSAEGPLLAAGDLNGDGIADLAFTWYTNQNTVGSYLSVLLANGDGTFTLHSTTPAAISSYEQLGGIALADLNRDGKLDLAVATPTQFLVFTGDGLGNLTALAPLAIGGSSEPQGLVLADFNGDGFIDAAGEYSGLVELLGASGSTFAASTWSPYSAIASGMQAYVAGAPVVADFNNDGHPDVALAGDASAYVMLGACWTLPAVPSQVTATPGILQATVSWTAPANTGGPPITGYQVTTSPGGAQMTITGATQATLTGLTADTAYTFSVAAKTAFGTGTAAVSNQVMVSGPPSAAMSTLAPSASSLHADGISSTTLTVTLHDAGGMPVAGAFVALTAKGTGNVIVPTGGVTNAEGVLKAALSSTLPGTRMLTATATTTAATQLTAPTIAVTAPVTFTSVACSGTSSFKAGSSISDTHQPEFVVTADFNKDGFLDLALANAADQTVNILLGSGSGSFSAAPGSPYAVGVGAQTWLSVGDVNLDGFLDLVASTNNTDSMSNAGITVLLGDGAGRFTLGPAVSSYYTSSGTSSLAIGDFNLDGLPDLAAAVTGSSLGLWSLPGNGTGTFGFTYQFGINNTAGYFQTSGVDFDGDGAADLAQVDPGTTSLSLYLSESGTPNSTGNPITVGTGPIAVVAADFNGDGIPDLAVANQKSDSVSILLGTGNEGGFNAATGSPVHVGSSPGSLVPGDFNGDGIADLAVVNEADNDVSVLIGTGHGGFVSASGSPFAVGMGPTWVGTGDFNGDGRLDLAVTNGTSGGVTILLNECMP